MSNEFDQDDVFKTQGEAAVDPGASLFENSQAGAPERKQEGGKKIAGMPLSTWVLIVGALIFVIFMLSRLVSGRAGTPDAGQLEPVADSAMTLEHETPAPADDGSAVSPTAATEVSPPTLAPTAPMETSEHAADLAVPTQLVAPAVEAPAPASTGAPQAKVLASLPVQATLPPMPAVAAAVAPAQPAPAVAPAVSSATQQELDAVKKQLVELQQEVDILKRGGRSLGEQSPPRRQAASVSRAPATKAKARTQPASPGKQPLAPVSGVSLRAVVGDVAWVQTAGGESVQVRPGDVIPGVGTVKTISAETSEVRLEDGRSLN